MPKASKSILINAPLKNVYKVVTDFETYPDFFPEVKTAKVVKQDKTSAQVDFVFHIMLTIKCRLKFKLMSKKVAWKLVKGDFMQDNVGAWDLKTKGKGTEATYTVEIIPTKWVPVSILEHLIEHNAPHMLKNLKKRCEKKTKKSRPKR